MKKTTTYLLGAFFIALSFASFFYLSEDNVNAERLAYEKYLREEVYPTMPRMNKKQIKSLPKADRPDLAAQQDFNRTMNPRTKRPEPEKLTSVFQMVQRRRKQFRGTPGAASTPWVERGPDNVGGRTRAIMYDPNDQSLKKVWAGGVTGGLWYNNDISNQNSAWTAVDDFWDNIAITCIAYDPNNTQTFYVGTGEAWGGSGLSSRGVGVWKTTDGGSTWSQLSATTEYFYVNDLVVRDENGSSALYVGVRAAAYEGQWHQNSSGQYNYGIYRSTNGGSSFSQVAPSVSGGSGDYTPADIKIGADNRIYVGTTDNIYGHGGGQVLYSDNGTSWTAETVSSGAGRVELGVAPSNANYVYALVESGQRVDNIYRSTNKGASWSSRSQPNDDDSGIPSNDFSRGQAWYDLVIAVDPNDENTIVAGAINLHRSTNGGNSWNQISMWYDSWGMQYSYVHADQHALIFKPGSSSELLSGSDGGVFRTTNLSSAANNDVWEARNNGYNVTQFYTCAIHPTANQDYFLAGAQDNGTQTFSLAGVNSTTEATGGDGAACFIDEDNPNYQITSYVYNVYYLSTNGGSSFNTTLSDDQGSGNFINTADYDSRQNALYSGYSSSAIQRVRNITSSPSVGTISTGDMGAYASNIKVSPFTTNSSTVFVGSEAGRVFKITNADGNASVSEIGSNSFPSGAVSSIEFGSSESEILVTFSNYGVSSVWYTTDGGSNWSQKEGNLPDMPIRWILMNPSDDNNVIVATEVGVWSTSNFQSGSPTWSSSNSGLANVRVDMLRMRSSDNEVIAATHGRGLFSSSAFGVAVAPTADFTASSTSIEEGETITFNDISAGSPTSWAWTFDGGSANATNQNTASVTYATAGTYDVTLIATNATGSDTIVKQDYITVSVKQAGPVGCDTMTNWTSSLSAGVVGFSAGSGTWTGHNSYQFSEFAEHFTGAQYETITGTELLVAIADYADQSTSKITVKVWAEGTDQPGAVIHEQDVLISNFTAGYVNIVDFDTAVSVPSNFYVGYEVYYNGNIDTFSVAHDYQNVQTNTAYTVYQGSWIDYTNLGGFNSTNYIQVYNCSYSEPVAANFTVSADSVCVGSNILLTDSSEGVGMTYAWSFGSTAKDTSSSTSGNQIISYNSAGTKTIKLTVSNGGSTSTVTKTVVVVDAPSTSAISGDDAVCYGESDLTYSVTNTSGSSYSWSVTGGLIVSGNSTNSIKVDWDDINATGEVVVYETSDFGCFGDEVSLSVEKTNASLTQLTGTTAICGDDTLQAYTADEDTNYTYHWTVTNGDIIGSDSTFGIEIDWSASGSIEVYATNKTCVSDTLSLNIGMGNDPAAVTVTGEDTLCSSLFGHTYSANNFVSGTECVWIIDNGTEVSSTDSTVTIDWDASGISTLKVVTMETTSGCTSDTTTFSLTKEVPTTSAISGVSSLCDGEQGTFTVSGSNGSTFAWAVTGGSLTTNSGTSVGLTVPTGMNTLTVIETNSAGCVGDTIKKVVSGSVTPEPTIIGDTAICAGDVNQSYSLGNIGTGGTADWYVNGAFPINETDSSLSINISGDATIGLVYTDSLGCVSDSTEVTVDVVAYPTITLEADTNLAELVNGAATINFTVEGYDASHDYSIDFGDGVTGAVYSSTFPYSYTSTGSYTVKVVADNGLGCKDSASVAIEIDINIGLNMAEDQSIAVYPNPAVDDVFVKFTQSASQVQVNVMNVIGATVYNQTIEQVQNGDQISIDVSDLEAGVYLVNVQYQDQVFQQEIIVQ